MDIKVTSNVDLNKFFQLLAQGLQLAPKQLANSMDQLGKELANDIISAIETRHPIGSFMGPRTQVDVAGTKGNVLITVKGIPDKTPYGTYNLWSAHEAGFNTGDVDYKLMAWQEESEWVFTMSRKGTKVTKYKDQVRKILNQLKPELKQKIKFILSNAANKQLEVLIAGASGNKIKSKITTSALGISPLVLAKAGVTAVSVTYPSMQVNYHGAGGKFVSPSKLGLPSKTKMNVTAKKKIIKRKK